jgi:sugar lactone lactonase YvrE
MRRTVLFLLVSPFFLANSWAQRYVINTLAGTPRLLDGSPAINAPLREPNAVALDANGNLYIADESDSRIRKVNSAGIISTYAGTGIPGYSGDRGQAASAQLNFPSGIALDGAGNLYIADEGNAVVRRIAVDGTINTVAGNGNPRYGGDNGPATSAQLDPMAVAVDGQGNLYIADAYNYRIRKVDTSGNITTIAGTGHLPGAIVTFTVSPAGAATVTPSPAISH